MSPIETFRKTNFPFGEEPTCLHEEKISTELEVKLEDFLQKEFGVQEHHGVVDEVRGYWGHVYVIGRGREEAEVVYSFFSIEHCGEGELDEDSLEINIVSSENILSRIKEALAEYKSST